MRILHNNNNIKNIYSVLSLCIILFPSSEKSLLHFCRVVVLTSTQLRRIYVTCNQWIVLTNVFRFCLYSHGLRSQSRWPNFENDLPSTWQIKYISITQLALLTWILDMLQPYIIHYTYRRTCIFLDVYAINITLGGLTRKDCLSNLSGCSTQLLD